MSMADHNVTLGAYLRARRDCLLPADVGLPTDPHRRVRGLRRTEVATLAGISAEYYLRLEQGRDHQPSPRVLQTLAAALRLDLDATAYLFRLAGQTPPAPVHPTRDSPAADQADPDAMDNVHLLLSQWSHSPAYVTDRHQDVVAVNSLGARFIPFALAPGANMLEAIVDGALAAGDERKEYWAGAVWQATAALRYCAKTDHPRLQLLVASLSARSAVFRAAWASHEAHPQRGGVAPVHIEPFGYINFRWQTLEIPGGGLYLTTFLGDPDSPSSAALDYVRARLTLEEELRRSGPVPPPPLDEVWRDVPG